MGPIGVVDQSNSATRRLISVSPNTFWWRGGGLGLAIARDTVDGRDEVVGDIRFGDEGARIYFDGLALHDA